jgi:hypothetical protein
LIPALPFPVLPRLPFTLSLNPPINIAKQSNRPTRTMFINHTAGRYRLDHHLIDVDP